MRLIIKNDAKEVSELIARHILQKIVDFGPTSSRPFVLGLPTGMSSIVIYKYLVQFCRKGEMSFRNVMTFSIDEYVGLPRDHAHSKHTFMWNAFFKHIDIKRENVHILDGNSNNLDEECAAYEQKLHECGGIDLMFFGTGVDGTLGRNEPGSSMTSCTRQKRMARGTIWSLETQFNCASDNSPHETKVPENSLTMGIGTIMNAKELVVVFCGRQKALALHKTIECTVNHMCPASIIQHHPNCLCVSDAAATLELRMDTCQYFSGIDMQANNR